MDSVPLMSIDFNELVVSVTFLRVRKWISCGTGLKMANSWAAMLAGSGQAFAKSGSALSWRHGESLAAVGCLTKSES